MSFKYIGETIRDFKVLERLDDTYFLVQCIHCGVIKKLSMQTLRCGLHKDGNRCVCDCTKSGIQPGNVFGRLTVVKCDTDSFGTGRLRFICQCQCGNMVSVKAKDLKSGNVRSCGCLAHDSSMKNLQKAECFTNPIDLTGERSGRLTVLRLATPEECVNRPPKVRYWLCQCDCGNTHIVSTSDFKEGKVQSCGCLNSKGEAKIKSILEQNHINYATQFYFDDLKGTQGRKYYFDFGILNENNKLLYLIEYDGIQHSDKNHQFSNDVETFYKVQERDRIKNDYCQLHNIPLIRIPYTHLENITIQDLQLKTSNFIYKKGGDE